MKPMTEPRRVAPIEEDDVAHAREGAADLADHGIARHMAFEHEHGFGDREQTDHEHDEVDAVVEVRAAEGEAIGAGGRIEADGGEHQDEDAARSGSSPAGFPIEPRVAKANTISHEVFGRSETDGEASEHRREEGEAEHAD